MLEVEVKNSIQEAVYDELKRAIMTLRYPPGTTMSTQEIATKLNVSRTPVRESFVRLQSEGLVETIPQRETLVSRIDLRRVEEERFIRESLEVAVVEPFLQKCTSSDFQKLRSMIEEQRKCWQEKRYADFVDCDNNWHKYMFDIAGQTLAWETTMKVNGHYNRIRVLTVQVDETSAGVLQQHGKILDLMENACLDEARAEVRNHVTKLNKEKINLVRLFPDYFKTNNTPVGIQIGKL